MDYDIRPINMSDSGLVSAARGLRIEAFALDPNVAEVPRTPERIWGAFEDTGRLAAVASDFAFGSFFGGVSLPTAGIGGVAVAPEHRGRGLASALMKAVVVGARERGAVLSTLFGAAPTLYRQLGYGMLANAYQWRIPMSKLAGTRIPAGYTLTRGQESDLPDIATFYAQLAAAGTGMADCAGIERVPNPVVRTTLVRDPAGRLAGVCSWQTTKAAGGVELRVDELYGVDPLANRALIAGLASWGSTVDIVTMTSVDSAPFWPAVPGVPTPGGIAPYMLRVLDPVRAVAERSWNAAATGTACFELRDPILGAACGSWRLEAYAGRAELAHAPTPASTVLTAEGFALWFAGVATCGELRHRGQLEGSDAPTDALMDALSAQPRPSLTHYF
jgi:predicted acetyltransferase